jgi:hypothetical protein
VPEQVGWVEALLDALEEGLCVDRTRVLGTGFSNGAMMVYQLAVSAPAPAHQRPAAPRPTLIRSRYGSRNRRVVAYPAGLLTRALRGAGSCGGLCPPRPHRGAAAGSARGALRGRGRGRVGWAFRGERCFLLWREQRAVPPDVEGARRGRL